MAPVAGTSVVLTYVRVIISLKSALSSYRLNQDMVSQPKDFHRMFDQFVQDLIADKANVTFSEQLFARFVIFVVDM